MVDLPDFLAQHREAAEKALEKKLVRDIDFSEGTYQIQVVDAKTKKEFWSFLQLDVGGKIKDCFCSCKEQSVKGVLHCVHIATAFLHIYKGHLEPLHLRFSRSLWNQLCQRYAERLGDISDILRLVTKGRYVYTSVSGKEIFSIEAKNEKGLHTLQSLLEERIQETEETSLKFSNLPQEEIALWREGRPSSQFRYRLSFWYDLAKWMMLMQDGGIDYRLTFEDSPQGIPHYLTVDFPDVLIRFYLSRANLPAIIPFLSTVRSPLVVHDVLAEAISEISYDKKKGALHLSRQPPKQKKTQKTLQLSPGINIDGWKYVSGDGFYAYERLSQLEKKELVDQDIEKILNDHFFLVKSHLLGTKVSSDTVHPSYSIFFDSQWNLHIVCYVFEPGDLTKPFSRKFGNWVYLDDEGFYWLEEADFEDVETVIPYGEVSDFVSSHRTWLNGQEGFRTHVTSVEAQLAYHLDEDNVLSFSTQARFVEDSSEHHDFGAWIYVAGQGFYSKISPHIGLPLRSGLVVSPDQIPLFIQINKEELQLVPGFFSRRCPIAKVGLNVELGSRDVILITPEYEVLPECREKDVRVFDEFVFVSGEGFHKLPWDPKLPERFRYPLDIPLKEHSLFLRFELDSIRPYALKMDPRLSKPQWISLRIEAMQRTKEKGKGLFSVKMHYLTERGEISLFQLLEAVQNKKRFVFSKAGMLDLSDPRFGWLRQLQKEQVRLERQEMILSSLDLLRLNAFEKLEVSESKDRQGDQTRSLFYELTQHVSVKEPDKMGLKSELRPYQENGVQWLWFLYQHGLSGLLCDEMGLGKTHQAMGLFAAVINHKRKTKKGRPCFLIVCPTSVIFHWEEKLEQFLPNVKVFLFYGLDRSLEAFSGKYDLLLTSYGIWRKESQVLKELAFDVAVLDEIQAAKNYTSRLHASLLNIQADTILGMTGTPIENHLRELKALFDIVLPTYMPSETEYREFFVKPIEKERDHERRSLLKRFVQPFILRRKKNEVLLDLPEKTEEIAHCALLADQQQLYADLLHRHQNSLLRELENFREPIPYLHVFALLSGLKQICNHPAAYLKVPSEYHKHRSGKWELFLELLLEARESEEKVVVFSQYLAMLDIMELYLKEHRIGFATIRGATKNRAEQVKRFNEDPHCEVFLGSLTASGVGIDLTAASVVIHYDRWWNAAKESQATDRVHRIGQTRGVQVFKLVTKGTFEERIDALIAKKGQAMEEIVGADEEHVIKSFSRDELIELVQHVEFAKSKEEDAMFSQR